MIVGAIQNAGSRESARWRGENSNGKIINQALTVDRWRVKPKSRTRGMMMAGGKKAEVEDHDGIRRHGQTDRRWRERAPLRDTEGWPFRERVAGGGGGWSMQQQRHHRQHFHPRFPFAAYIPRFLFLPALSHGHSSGFLSSLPLLPFLSYLSSPSKSSLSILYTPTERIAPPSLLWSFALPLFLSSAFSPTTSFQPLSYPRDDVLRTY